MPFLHVHHVPGPSEKPRRFSASPGVLEEGEGGRFEAGGFEPGEPCVQARVGVGQGYLGKGPPSVSRNVAVASGGRQHRARRSHVAEGRGPLLPWSPVLTPFTY